MHHILKDWIFRPRLYQRALKRVAIASALAIMASGCSGSTSLSLGNSGPIKELLTNYPGIESLEQSGNGSFYRESIIQLEYIAAETDATSGLSHDAITPASAIMAELAAAEMSDHELDDMRGGIAFNAGIEINFTIDFVTHINDTLVAPVVPANIGTFPGILTRVEDGIPTVTGSNNFSGVISLVQNGLDFQDIHNTTLVRAEIFGAMTALRGNLITSQLSFGAAAGF